MTTYIANLDQVPSYTGPFPSPLPVMWYVPANAKELLKVRFSPNEIRGWVQDAAVYHDVPYELAAVILQQENGPNATTFQKVGQFAERSATTFFAIVDEVAFDLIPDKIAGGSAGIANLSRATLRDAAGYIETTYNKRVLPANVRDRVLGWKQDTRIQGDDLKSDLYYMTAHLRQLIDRVTGQPQYSGPLTLEQAEKVAAAYNGSGPKAVKYGKDAMTRLQRAIKREEPLYFYEVNNQPDFSPYLPPIKLEGPTHSVKPGDSLSEIAKQFYGDAGTWPRIYEANKAVIGNNPNLIRPGQKLVIPPQPGQPMKGGPSK